MLTAHPAKLENQGGETNEWDSVNREVHNDYCNRGEKTGRQNTVWFELMVKKT